MYRSSSFRPVLKGLLERSTSYDVKGNSSWVNVGKVKFAFIHNRDRSLLTSIRTDRSGSQGHAREDSFSGRILLEIKIEPLAGDRFTFDGVSRLIEEVHLRYDQAGVKHHYQVDLRRE